VERFGEKIGGLPVWAWSLILGLILVAAMYWFRARATASAAMSPGADTGAGALDGLLGGGTGLTSSPGTPVGGDTGDGLSQFVANSTWEAQGVAYLIGQAQSPLAAQTALEQYLAGNPLSAQQSDMVNSVIAAKGLPPQGVLSLSEIINPTTGRTPSQDAEFQADQQAVKDQLALTAAANPATVITNPTTVVQGGLSEADKQVQAQAAVYLANFTRPLYWYGASADAAKAWLIAHGYSVPAPSKYAQQQHYLSTHDAFAAAYKAGGSTLRTFLSNHPIIAREWAALQ
jgi:hypothetical protein